MISGTATNRAEIRRLTSWFDEQFYANVVAPLMHERMLKRILHRSTPDGATLREAMKSANQLMDYVDWLLDHRNWLAGATLSLADLAAAAPATPPTPSVEIRPSITPSPSAGLRTVVIDPGHGGEELGAQGPRGTLEKDITLAVSKRLRTLIESRLGLRVFLTREDDRTVSPDDRLALASNHRADLFHRAGREE